MLTSGYKVSRHRLDKLKPNGKHGAYHRKPKRYMILRHEHGSTAYCGGGRSLGTGSETGKKRC